MDQRTNGRTALADRQDAVRRMVAEYRDAITASMAQPEREWQCYVVYGALPPEARWWLKLFDFLTGHRRHYRLYVGQTGQEPKMLRITQHATKQEWRNRVSMVEILPTIYHSEAAALVAESRLFVELRPMYNKAGIVANPMSVHEAQRRVPRYMRQRRIRFAVTAALFLLFAVAGDLAAPDWVPIWVILAVAGSVALAHRLGRWVLRLGTKTRPRAPARATR